MFKTLRSNLSSEYMVAHHHLAMTAYFLTSRNIFESIPLCIKNYLINEMD
jgi:hypothetical protein